MIDPLKPNFMDTPVAAGRAEFGYAAARRDVMGEGNGGILPDDLPPGAVWKPAATVVTPFYNTREVFHETARCVLGQSLQNFQWVIVNDGSKDPEALAALEGYRKRDPRIRVIDHRVNHGLPAARNTGVRSALAPHVFFLDSDDLIEPTTLEKCALFLELNPNYGFVKGFNVGFGAQEYLWTKGFHDGEKFLRDNLATATTMVRMDTLRDVGGFDESIRAGMEDWAFWLRCASKGWWGGTIPEYLDWYRRRDNQQADWGNLRGEEKKRAFLSKMALRHPELFEGGFPSVDREWQMPFHACVDKQLFANPLARREGRKRLLLIVPWLRMGGADKFNLDLVRYLTTRAQPGYDVTIATTLPGSSWLPEFARWTPDVFLLDHLTRPQGYGAALRHLIASRRPDVVMISNSQHGYGLLPYLRAHHPEPVYVDFNHMEEPHWQNGGHPRTGMGYQEQLDLNMVVSGHLKRWMVEKGAEESRVAVCHINADPVTFRPDEQTRARVRAELGISERATVILYAARLCPQKQPRVFAETMRLLAAERPNGDFVALVAGDGELTAELEGLLRGSGVLCAGVTGWIDDKDAAGLPVAASHGEPSVAQGCVCMLGAVAAGRMPELMAAADVFFLPSLWEGIALSIYEAMAAGLAVVGADVGGQTELVTQECGVLMRMPSPRDEGEEARGYARVLGELLDDPERVRAYGAAARRRIVEHFELDKMGERFVALLAEAKELHDRKPRLRLGEGFARELAVQGVEMARIHELAEYLWPYRDKWLRTASESERRRVEAEEELRQIESSRTYRVVQGVKKTIAYRAFARARYGAGWESLQAQEDPMTRLERVRGSRAFRVIQAMKSVPPWSVYVRVKYGHTGERKA